MLPPSNKSRSDRGPHAHLPLKTSTAGRNMAGARALWRATGMQDADFQNP